MISPLHQLHANKYYAAIEELKPFCTPEDVAEYNAAIKALDKVRIADALEKMLSCLPPPQPELACAAASEQLACVPASVPPVGAAPRRAAPHCAAPPPKTVAASSAAAALCERSPPLVAPRAALEHSLSALPVDPQGVAGSIPSPIRPDPVYYGTGAQAYAMLEMLGAQLSPELLAKFHEGIEAGDRLAVADAMEKMLRLIEVKTDDFYLFPVF